MQRPHEENTCVFCRERQILKKNRFFSRDLKISRRYNTKRKKLLVFFKIKNMIVTFMKRFFETLFCLRQFVREIRKFSNKVTETRALFAKDKINCVMARNRFFSARNFPHDHARAIHLVLNNAQNGGKIVCYCSLPPTRCPIFPFDYIRLLRDTLRRKRAYLTIFI